MKKKLTFEEGMKELEELTGKLERGEMPLEESFKAYERAIQLKKMLEALLDEGDEKIRILTENGEKEMKADDLK